MWRNGQVNPSSMHWFHLRALVVAGIMMLQSCGRASFESTSKTSEAAKVDSGSQTRPSDDATAASRLEREESYKAQSIATYKAVDVIFLVDTSGSMREEIKLLETHMKSFLQTFEKENAKLDYQVFIVSRFFYLKIDNPRVETLQAPIESLNALTYMQYFYLLHNFGSPPPAVSAHAKSLFSAVSNPKARLATAYNPTLKLRDDSVKEVIVITDDNAIGNFNILSTKKNNKVTANRRDVDPISIKGIKGFLEEIGQLDKTKINAVIFTPNSEANANCTKAAVGTTYIELAADPVVGGKIFDLCSSNWSKLLEDLAEQVKQENLVYTYDLADQASTIIEVSVNDRPIDSKLYTFDQSLNRLTLHPEALQAITDTVGIRYQLQEKAP